MWIVRLALRRLYTFIVAALLLLIVSPLVIPRPPDIFTNINILVVGLSPNNALNAAGGTVVHLRGAKLARDLGTIVEAAQGLSVTDRVAVNPSGPIFDGEKVDIAQSGDGS